uniref:Uncharacterized protein n=1 Tax=Meloidogyne enterolobii TaxID=390850 RepID=A0A6V7XFK0_MELEN|nr:unnamed protein product [Meloidogyne enterolobii]
MLSLLPFSIIFVLIGFSKAQSDTVSTTSVASKTELTNGSTEANSTESFVSSSESTGETASTQCVKECWGYLKCAYCDCSDECGINYYFEAECIKQN